MTLLIINNQVKVINDNLSTEMYVLIKQKKVNIVRFNEQSKVYEKLIIDNDKLCWVKVPIAKRLVYKDSIVYE